MPAAVIESVDAGKSVIPPHRYLQAASGSAALDHVVISSEKRSSLTIVELSLVRNHSARAYVESFVGYRLRRMLYEIVDEDEFEKIKGYRSLHIVKRLSAHDLPETSSIWKGNRALCEATAETFADDSASLAARPFIERSQPILDFTPSQKKLLVAALREAENVELVDTLCRTPAAIKRTWMGIFGCSQG